MKTPLGMLSVAILMASPCLADESPGIETTSVQWTIEEGGNGHWYKFIDHGSSIGWNQASELAADHGGHLATFTSLAENNYISGFLMPQRAWIGGYQKPGSCEPGCDWVWITGEPWDFNNWLPGEPNNQGDEGFLESKQNGLWNDVRENDGTFTTYVVEWDADCNGDGIVDYGQILDGTYVDLDGNGIPDCCESDTPCDEEEFSAIQWKFEDGGNGHWYMIRDGYIPWTDARDTAENLGGRLCSMETVAELDWLMMTILEPYSETLFADGGWGVCIGGIQTSQDDEPIGNWEWLTGVPFECNNDYECNMENYLGNQNYMSLVRNTGQPIQFNDIDNIPDQPYFMVEWSVDCNGDGIVDYGQILDGTYEDTNANGVPDICESGPEITVDDDLLEFPNADFISIQDAIDAATDGDVIHVYPGTYTSSNEYIMNLGDKRLKLLGIGGATETILDGQNERAGIYCTGFHDDETVISGFTIANGRRTDSAHTMIWLREASGPTLSDCIVRDCHGQVLSSGPNHLGDPVGHPRIIRCTFQNNEWSKLLITFNYNEPYIEDCRFIGNTALYVGFSYWPNNKPSYVDCLFEGNTVGADGILHARSGSAVDLSACRFRNNIMQSSCVLGSSNDGGGMGYFNVAQSEFCNNGPSQGICSDWNDLGGNKFEDYCTCDADVYPDGMIDISDLLIVIAYYGLLEPAAGDVNMDGQVDSEDILGVLDQWGTCDAP